LVDRKKRVVVETSTSPAPWFFVVSDTLNVLPAAAVAGAVTADTIRSGPTLIDPVDFALLVSTVSGTAASQSALARMKYEPVVTTGRCSVVARVSLAPGASVGTLLLPRKMSDASQVLFVDR
jgi:hypothetical protein